MVKMKRKDDLLEKGKKIVAHSQRDQIIVSGKQKRMTKQKTLIWHILAGTKSHPTADWIYGEARKEMPNISLGTVYRNLQLLVSDGIAQELNYGKGVSRFDANIEPHYHFVCTHCGKIEDIPVSVREDVMSYAKSYINGEVSCYRLEYYGICNQCCKKNVKQ